MSIGLTADSQLVNGAALPEISALERQIVKIGAFEILLRALYVENFAKLENGIELLQDWSERVRAVSEHAGEIGGQIRSAIVLQETLSIFVDGVVKEIRTRRSIGNAPKSPK